MKRFLARIRSDRTLPAIAIALALIVFNQLLFLTPIYRVIGGDTVLTINAIVNISAALAGIWLGFRLWRSAQRGESLRAIWGSLTTGLILWLAGEMLWDIYQYLRGIQMPTSSPADIAWMLGYIAIIAGVWLRIRSLRMRLTKPWQYAVLAGFAVAVILAVLYIILPILYETHIDISYNRYIGLFYGICDLALGFLALLLMLLLEGGLLSKPWAVIAAACFCVAVSNLLYAYTLSHGIYQLAPAAGLDLLSYLVDTCYTLAYILMTLGLYLQARLLDAI